MSDDSATCKHCGSELERYADSSEWKCRDCGSVFTLPHREDNAIIQCAPTLPREQLAAILNNASTEVVR